MSLSRIRTAAFVALAVTAAAVTSAQNAAARTLPPRAPKTHVVKMITENGKQIFDPVKLTIQVGDTVEWLAVSGSHNVAFWADSVPKGAAELLKKAMPETTKELTGPRKPKKGDKYVMVFAGMPKGEYEYYCTPHLKKMMVGTLIIK